MAIKSLRAKNFIQFQDTGWLDLQRINLIYGHNSSGKSILRQILEVFKTALSTSDNNDYFALEKLPNPRNYDGDTVFIFRVTSRAGLLSPLAISTIDPDVNIDIDLYLFFSEDKQNPQKATLNKLNIQISQPEKAWAANQRYIFKAEHNDSQAPWILSSDFLRISPIDETWKKVTLSSGFIPSISGINETIWDIIKKEDNNYDASNELVDSKDEIGYLYKFLEIVKNEILFLLESVRFISPTYSKKTDDLNFLDSAIEKDNFKKEISIWFKENELFDDLCSKFLISSGARSIASLVENVLSLQSDNLAMIEHPEAFLDQQMQLSLMDYLINTVIKRDIKIIIETNSEMMLLRLMKRIRQTSKKKLPKLFSDLKIKQQDIAIWVVTKKTSQTPEIFSIKLNDYGELMTPWPGGFFEEGFDERFS